MILLNELLTSTASVAVQMPFHPVELSCDEQLNWSADGDRFVYGTVVYMTDAREWAIYEFHQPIMDALEAYRFRNGGIQALEFCLSRHADGELKIAIGRSNLKPVREQVEPADYDKWADRAGRLGARYAKLAAQGPVKILI